MQNKLCCRVKYTGWGYIIRSYSSWMSIQIIHMYKVHTYNLWNKNFIVFVSRTYICAYINLQSWVTIFIAHFIANFAYCYTRFMAFINISTGDKTLTLMLPNLAYSPLPPSPPSLSLHLFSLWQLKQCLHFPVNCIIVLTYLLFDPRPLSLSLLPHPLQTLSYWVL